MGRFDVVDRHDDISPPPFFFFLISFNPDLVYSIPNLILFVHNDIS